MGKAAALVAGFASAVTGVGGAGSAPAAGTLAAFPEFVEAQARARVTAEAYGQVRARLRALGYVTIDPSLLPKNVAHLVEVSDLFGKELLLREAMTAEALRLESVMQDCAHRLALEVLPEHKRRVAAVLAALDVLAEALDAEAQLAADLALRRGQTSALTRVPAGLARAIGSRTRWDSPVNQAHRQLSEYAGRGPWDHSTVTG